jgi:hypothetical protein
MKSQLHGPEELAVVVHELRYVSPPPRLAFHFSSARASRRRPPSSATGTTAHAHRRREIQESRRRAWR